MRFGFYLPTRGKTATPEALEALATRGEALGFSSVVIADHIVFPVRITSKYPYTVSGAFPGQGDALEQAITDDIGHFAGLGVSGLIFDFRTESLDQSLDRMERFAPFIRRPV
ncbi:MAG TPA: hypothetical protein VJX92_02620 [Methylomirabilota bacterium]|nr:hypothetical protein [Methylomirabilota bacterium]